MSNSISKTIQAAVYITSWITNIFATSDVRRVPDIFKKPVFFKFTGSGTPKSAEIVQGAVEDCYLVSALSCLTALCQRDEEIGVYGFLFYRDCYWVPTIVDEYPNTSSLPLLRRLRICQWQEAFLVLL